MIALQRAAFVGALSILAIAAVLFLSALVKVLWWVVTVGVS